MTREPTLIGMHVGHVCRRLPPLLPAQRLRVARESYPRRPMQPAQWRERARWIRDCERNVTPALLEYFPWEVRQHSAERWEREHRGTP